MRIPLVWIAFLLSRISFAQINDEAKMATYPIQVGWDKTTVLVFPSEVSSADFGSSAVISQKDKAAPNVIKLKARERFFSSTSMYVITVDGKLYPFTVSYTDFPDVRPIDMGRQLNMGSSEALLKGLSMRPTSMNRILDELSHSGSGVKSWGKKQGQVRLGKGTMVEKNGMLFFQVVVDNWSGVYFLPDQWKFTVQDKNQSKRTAIRQLSIEPVAFSDFKGVLGKSTSLAVFAFPGFTISDAKELKVQVFEKKGDRNPEIFYSGKELLKVGKLITNNIN